MSYTIAELESAIEDEETQWEGSYFEFEDQLDSKHEYVVVAEGTEGARTYDGGETWEKRVEKANPGLDLPGIGRAELVEQHGGMDQGSQLWLVFKVTDADGDVRHFRKSGWYQSYSGGDYDGDLEEVEPFDKTITVWKAIK